MRIKSDLNGGEAGEILPVFAVILLILHITALYVAVFYVYNITVKCNCYNT